MDELKSFYSPQGRLPYPWHARASELKINVEGAASDGGYHSSLNLGFHPTADGLKRCTK